MTTYDIVIIGTLVVFFALAYMLLAPVNRFLDRETELSEKWTKEALARRSREEKSGTNGKDEPDDQKKKNQ